MMEKISRALWIVGAILLVGAAGMTGSESAGQAKQAEVEKKFGIY